MKRRCVPLRGDHNLLTPNTHTLSEVRLPEQVWSEGVASLSGHLSGASSRGCLAVFPARRLRFEDETEMEVESRYLERQQQRRRAEQRGTVVLASKPELNLYMNGQVGLRQKGVEPVTDGLQKRREVVGVLGSSDLYGAVFKGRVNSDPGLCQRTPVMEVRGRSLNRPHLHLWTEPLRETHIGFVSPADTNRGTDWAGHIQTRWRANQIDLNGLQATALQAPPTTDLPINPYASFAAASHLHPSAAYSGALPIVTSEVMSKGVRTEAGEDLTQNQWNQERPAAVEPHSDLQSGSQLKMKHPSVKEEVKNPSSSSVSRSSSAEDRASPSSGSGDGQVTHPMSVELHKDDVSHPEEFRSRKELSLCHLFSSVRLRRARTVSLDQLTSKNHSPVPDHSRSHSLLKKSLSVQSLCAESPVSQLKKLSSVWTFGSEQKKKDPSADYRPVADQFLPRCLSSADISQPHQVQSVGRVLQVCSDRTFLLELFRPTGQTFGFIISRDKGRTDSGIYVEDMENQSTAKLYSGLLEVGDEILEVNGEKVACLSVDQVTQLLIQKPSAIVLVDRQPRVPPQ